MSEIEQVRYETMPGADPSTVYQRQRVAALNRLAAEVRGLLKDAPPDDPDVVQILRDCDTVEQCARMFAGGIPANSIGFRP